MTSHNMNLFVLDGQCFRLSTTELLISDIDLERGICKLQPANDILHIKCDFS